ncbi:hypothetical protein Cgig2_021157 [Carnegiea gigantea]|uniref:Transcription initiation factor TFIID component TAF4 C-terminal domain-containing protein n=1 Tax=Carnegiea gigantea TaxID=171969 RepID=A0A9Q1KX41_9CARY|nr:hypothetical protein Cgig2_021157 [Carnegiea gigantea]
MAELEATELLRLKKSQNHLFTLNKLAKTYYQEGAQTDESRKQMILSLGVWCLLSVGYAINGFGASANPSPNPSNTEFCFFAAITQPNPSRLKLCQLGLCVGNNDNNNDNGSNDGMIFGRGLVRQSGRSQVTAPPPRAARNISVKDMIAVLEREPQMAKSTVIYRLYEKMRAEAATE